MFQEEGGREYLRLSPYFETQENLAYCGVASSVVVLNALMVERPPSSRHPSYALYTQVDFFDSEAEYVVEKGAVERRGMTLEELSGLLRSKGVQVSVKYADEVTAGEFRQDLVQSMKDPRSSVLVNYKRSEIGQESGGHISPVGGFHSSSDSVLVLDVARYKYPPVWIPLDLLWRGMTNVDEDSGRARGYVIVSPE